MDADAGTLVMQKEAGKVERCTGYPIREDHGYSVRT